MEEEECWFQECRGGRSIITFLLGLVSILDHGDHVLAVYLEEREVRHASTLVRSDYESTTYHCPEHSTKSTDKSSTKQQVDNMGTTRNSRSSVYYYDSSHEQFGPRLHV